MDGENNYILKIETLISLQGEKVEVIGTITNDSVYSTNGKLITIKRTIVPKVIKYDNNILYFN